MTPEERFAATNNLITEANDRAWGAGRRPTWGVRTYAYAAWLYDRPDLMEKALENLNFDGDMGSVIGDWTQGRVFADGELNIYPIEEKDSPRVMDELKYTKTNGIAQWSLNYMETVRLHELMAEKTTEGGNE